MRTVLVLTNKGILDVTAKEDELYTLSLPPRVRRLGRDLSSMMGQDAVPGGWDEVEVQHRDDRPVTAGSAWLAGSPTGALEGRASASS